ncbi:hypothetical protein CDAR_472551 [Caerostris darwini]|uniref:Uncharacterized protein n=1 Tax=Caerostris darwini TaxID=1538125 RepID=A0AAV4RVX7_9ARAC|nr:hypothetical protein CDAR_472551 [Caerostris darwini]
MSTLSLLSTWGNYLPTSRSKRSPVLHRIQQANKPTVIFLSLFSALLQSSLNTPLVRNRPIGRPPGSSPFINMCSSISCKPLRFFDPCFEETP